MDGPDYILHQHSTSHISSVCHVSPWQGFHTGSQGITDLLPSHPRAHEKLQNIPFVTGFLLWILRILAGFVFSLRFRRLEAWLADPDQCSCSSLRSNQGRLNYLHVSVGSCLSNGVSTSTYFCLHFQKLRNGRHCDTCRLIIADIRYHFGRL